MFYRKNLPANTAPAIIIYPKPLFFFFLPASIANIYLNVDKILLFLKSFFFQVSNKSCFICIITSIIKYYNYNYNLHCDDLINKCKTDF